jgi:hypothetical protein
MKGSTSFLHKYNVRQNKHQTESKEIICCLFPANMLLYLMGQLVVDVTSFTCFAALMLHHTLHMNRTTGGLLFFLRCYTGKPRLHYQVQYSKILSGKPVHVSFLLSFLFLMIHLCTTILMYISLLKNIFNDFCINLISIKAVYNHFSIFEPHITHLHNCFRNVCYC